MDVEDLSERRQQKGWDIIKHTNIYSIWESIGAEINLVGSLPNGLMMKHLDIDLHIYSSPLTLADSFAAMAILAENPSIKKIECINLLDTIEECIEWHASYEDDEGEMWMIDMIHIRKGSQFDGHVEKVTKRVKELLTPKARKTILQLKYDTPNDIKIMGIEYYKAVLEDGVKTFDQLIEWKKNNPPGKMIEWMP